MYAHPDEPVDLRLVEHSQRARNVDLDLAADRLDPSSDAVEQAVVGRSYRSDNAELRRAGFCGLLRGFDEARYVQSNRAHRRLEQPGLRAEMAVLRATAGLQTDDALDLDFGPTPRHSDLVSESEQLLQSLVGYVERAPDLRPVQPHPVGQHLLARDVEDVVSVCYSAHGHSWFGNTPSIVEHRIIEHRSS